jgi:hypothetical protein
MTTVMEGLAATTGCAQSAKSFSPVARYYPNMDYLLYLKEDCSYRADRVDGFLTLMIRPDSDELVGIKLKGFRFLFERIKGILEIPDAQFVPLAKALEIALVGAAGQQMMAHAERKNYERVQARYRQAREFAAGVDIPSEELKRAA